MYITIFKTSIATVRDFLQIKPLLDLKIEIQSWTIDLDDCDKILRVVSPRQCKGNVTATLKANGYYCEELPYSLS
ncbi:hypothetical protein [Arcticibacter svalbardensis]|uniref:hypothetical protein n=1 Tax=Arcticibacter svalbardensis TaxID=1288027 RepID=UPI0003A50084|nr:hypothetical protein [Arcticibacter svalbardensis]